MSLASTLTGMITGGLDMAFGGEPTKIALTPDDERATMPKIPFELQFNPESLKITRAQARTSTPVMGSQDRPADQNAAPQRSSTMQFTVYFDTYEERSSVYTKYIKTLESFVGYDQGKHAPVMLVMTYGNFTNELTAMSALKCKLDNLDVEYTMFLKNGTPVRAKVGMTFRLGLTPEDQNALAQPNSPDHAKLVTLKRGHTLADVAAEEYDNPAEWRRIARANNIDDPMDLEPGAKLIVPPILTGVR